MGDLLGESCISFRTLSLLTTCAIYLQISDLISPSRCITTCPSSMWLHPFQPIEHSPSSHISVAAGVSSGTNQMTQQLHPLQPISAAHLIPACQLVAQNRPCSTIVMDSLNMQGSQGQWGVGGYNALVEGEFILPSLSLHCPTYMNNERNLKEPNKVKC